MSGVGVFHDGGAQPAEVVEVGDVLRQGAGRHLREVRRDGGAAGEAAVGGVGVELRHAAGVRVDGLPAAVRRRIAPTFALYDQLW